MQKYYNGTTTSLIFQYFLDFKMNNEEQKQTEASATQKATHNPEVKKLMQELDGTDILLREYETLLANAKKLSDKYKDPTIHEIAITRVGTDLITCGSHRKAERRIRISSLETALKLLF
ncbi:MAG: hypothetical protein AAB221_06650, partial [Bacteroidota bacterium]